MGKKRVGTVMMVLVVGLVAPIVVSGADPGLVGWWKFDGDGLDASGNGRDGIAMGDAHFEPGHMGQALALDGAADYFAVTDWKGLMSDSPVTVTAWVQTTGNGTMVYWGRNANGRRVDFRVNGGRLRVEHNVGNVQGDTVINDGEWHHIALSIEANAPISYPQVKLYVDGRDDTRNTQDPDLFNLATHNNNVDVTFGYRPPQADRDFAGLLDDVRFYDRILAEAEIKDIMELGYLASAHTPVPADSSRYDDVWVQLEWTPGPLAVSHNVYFGTSFEDVDAGAEGTLLGNTTGNAQVVGLTGFPLPEGLMPGTTYYWRVEEVGTAHPDSPWHGQVWSFWVPPLTAFSPAPADGEPFEDPSTDLSWAAGMKAIVNSVYFGTDPNQVASATEGIPQVETTYDPGLLDLDTTYYWRVDTFNGMEYIPSSLWSFHTMPEIARVGDPNLVAWWTFDEGAGTNALDWSGNGNHVKLFGDTAWMVPGREGTSALDFTGGGYGAIKNLYYDDPNNPEVSVAVWMRTSDPNDQFILSFDRDSFYRLEVNGNGAADGRVGWCVETVSSVIDYGSGTRVDDGLWHHVCGVFDNGTATVYIDGVAEPSAFPPAGAVFDSTFGSTNVRYGLIGRNSEATEFNGAQNANPSFPITGDIDDLRIYDKALTEAEILQLMRVDPLQAWDLRPTNGRIVDFGTVSSLRWRAGDGAAKHDVYFGTDAAALASADASDATGIYRGQRATTTYTPTEGLVWGQKYYWRIDEVGADGTVTPGSLHTFTVADYITIEDFETYVNDSPNRVFQTWIDGYGYSPDEHFPNGGVGNGSGSFCGNDPAGGGHIQNYQNAYSGRWCLPMDYNNVSFPYYSEIERTWTTAQNWTVNGVDALTVHYLGGTFTDANAPMYVRIEDSAGKRAEAVNPDPNAVAQTEWQAWSIPLADLTAAGVNTQAITKMVIGVRNPAQGPPTSAGRIFIDAVRLTRQPAVVEP